MVGKFIRELVVLTTLLKDEDEMNAFILLDNNLIKLANGFKPHFNVPKFGDYEISGNLNIPNTSLITLAAYNTDGELPNGNESCEVYDMLQEIEHKNVNLDLTK